MDWKTIPSLAALRAFEATARHCSVTKAAADLNVTHAAVSQHLRALEADLGVTLAARAGRTLSLTAEGRALAAALSEGFGLIETGVADLRAQTEARPLSLSLTPHFAESWLMPRLGRLWTKHPDIPVTLQPDQALVDLRTSPHDLAIRYGRGNWTGVASELLTQTEFVVIGAAGQFPKGGGEAALRRQKWFFNARQSEFQRWVEEVGLIDENTETIEQESTALSLAAVRQGYGLMVAFLTLIQPEVDAGVFDILCRAKQTEHNLGYHIVTRTGPRSPRLETVIRWLHSEVARG